jgi:hypothetical protein
MRVDGCKSDLEMRYSKKSTAAGFEPAREIPTDISKVRVSLLNHSDTLPDRV